MSNNLRQAKKDLKAFAKRAKDVKYTESLLFSYLITGMITFSIGLNTSSNVLYERLNKELVMSADKTRTAIKKKKKANEEAIEDLNLDLIQLMEQGDQVVKSPWQSWQFGANTFISSNNGTYKGRGDKAEKYSFNSIYNRGNWADTGILSNRRKSYMTSSLSTSTIGKQSYGLASLLHVQEPEVEIQIMANVRPKSVSKEEIAINPKIDMPREVVRPNINLKVTEPITAPTILIPTLKAININVPDTPNPGEVSKVEAPSISITLAAPTIGVSITPPTPKLTIDSPTPTVNTLTIEAPEVSEVSAITVNKPVAPSITPPNPSVNAVSFEVPSLTSFGNSPTGDNSLFGVLPTTQSRDYRLVFSGEHKITDGIPKKQNSIIEYMGNGQEYKIAEGSILTVDVSRSRAVALDTGFKKYLGGKDGTSYDSGIKFSVENKGTIDLTKPITGGMEIQPDVWDYAQATAINSGIIKGNSDNQAALLITKETTYRDNFEGTTRPSKGNRLILKNKKNIELGGKNSAGFATGNFQDDMEMDKFGILRPKWSRNIEAVAINEKDATITLTGEKSHGMVVSQTDNELEEHSKFENKGLIKVKGSESGGITLLAKLSDGAINSGTIEITGNNSFGLYSQYYEYNDTKTSGTPRVKVGGNISPVINSQSGKINIEGTATKSIGIRVGSESGKETGLKNLGTITINSIGGENIGIYSGTSVINNDGTIEVRGKKNIGMMLKETKSDTNSPSGNKKKITVDGTNGFGVMLIDNDNSAEFNNYTNAEIVATGVNSVGLYTKNSIATNKNGATISSTQYHAVVQNGGTFTNSGIVSTESGGKAGLYSENGTFTIKNDGEVKSSNGGIAVFTSGSIGTIEGKVTVGASDNSSTGIGVYSDGSSTRTTFQGNNAELTLGTGTVGLYSSKASDFGNVFTINKLKTSIGDGAVFAYFGNTGNTTDDTVNITNTTLQNLTVSSMGTNSAIFYGAKNTTININGNITADSTKFSNINDSAQFLVSDNGIVNINSGKTLTSELKTTISGLNGATVTNEGTLALTGKDGAVGIYSNASTATNSGTLTTNNQSSIGIYGKWFSTLTNNNVITTSGNKSVGIFAENSTVENKGANGKITAKGTQSAGIYGMGSIITNEKEIITEETGSAGIYANDSDVTNKSTGKITIQKGSSAGIYATSTSMKNVTNDGDIEVGLAGSSEIKGVGIYAGGYQNVEHNGNINIHMGNSIGIYGEGENVSIENKNKITSDASVSSVIGIMADKAKVSNLIGSEIKLQGKDSVGVYGINESEIENSGSILITSTDNDSKSVGILADKGTATNKGTIKVAGGKSAGMLGLNGATITNDATTGVITITGDASAGMYVENSLPSNAGTINIESNESAGIFAKITDVATRNIENTGTIKLGGTSKIKSVGMYAEIGSGATGITTLDNKNQITVEQEKSVGMFVKNGTSDRTKGKALNNATTGKIDLNVKETVGIYAYNAEGVNDNVINVTKENSAGMYGSTDSHITNNKEIAVSHEKSAGMYALDSNATNTATGTITLTGSATAADGSAGMYGKLTSNATTVDYTILNQGKIQLTSVTKNVGIYGTTGASVSKKLTLQNEKEINIASGSKQSVGIFAKNDVSNDKDKLVAINTSSGTIVADSEKSIGISAEKGTVDNSGTITMKKAESAGIYGKSGSKVTNNKEIEMKENQSAGIYLENSDAENATNGTITVDKGASAGIYGKFTSDATADNTIVNNGKITLTATGGEEKSAGIYGERDVTATKKLTITNNKEIEVNMNKSVGIYALNERTKNRDDLVAENTGSAGEIKVNSEDSVGMLASNSVANNKKKITVNNKKSTGMYGENGSLVTNTDTGEIEITAAGEKGMGIYATGENTTTGKVTEGVNDGTININGKEGIGMLATAKGKVTNNNKINGSSSVEGIIGMYGSDDKTKIENASTGKIELAGKKSTGMFAKDDAVAENSGNIKLTSDSKNSVGMFGSSSGAGKKINLTNKNIIDVESESSTGMFTKNSGNLTDSIIKNEGTINQKAKNTVGIYTPKSDIQKVGKINLTDDAESSVAVYLSNTAKADSSTGEIDLNIKSQNQVAYYVKGTSTEPTGALYGGNIGKVKGYGVGVYLDGGTLDGNSSKLDYTTSAASGFNGNGIIGLLMKNDADISAYNKNIKVGDSAELPGKSKFYAIGIYADAQGSSTTPKTIATSITTGKDGVGLFAENSSHIKYIGIMNIGANKVAGTGIYVGNGGTGAPNPSTVTVGSGAHIKLEGENGVGVIVTSKATADFETGSKIEFKGAGVGVFGQKGAIINNASNINLITNGNSVERTRITEGSSITPSDLTIANGRAMETGNILSHVINGEAIINKGVTVEAKPSTQNIIGLMADGNKDPHPTRTTVWTEPLGYEAENNGKLDLSNATKSTAMYLDSSRGINKGEIIVGNSSTGIYGIYDKDISVYSVAPSGTVNTGTITTTAGSKIKIGNESSAIYSIGFDKVENKGIITGGDKSVGIYAKNTAASSKNINVANEGDITLGKGSAGIYIAPETSNNPNATVTNSGNIVIGDSTLDASGNVDSTSVGIFVKNKTNLTTTGDVTVGNRGFALYGNDSTLTVNGGNYNFANSGSLAYLENNAVLNYNNTGTLTTSSEPMLYIINSKAHMNNNDIVVSAGGTGVYMNGTSTFSGWNNMTLNNGSTGIYVDKSSAVIDGNKITGVSNKAKGIVAIDSNVTNKANMEFSSDDSIGIFSQNKSGAAKAIVNSGNIDITGKRSIAAYLEGTSDQTFENSGIINVDRTATSVKNDSTVGIYAQNSSTINVKNSGTINVGESSFGIYSLSENGKVETAGSSVINVADKAIGIYKKGGVANVAGVINVANHTATDANSEPVGVYGSNGITITDTTSSFNVGDKSYGVILANPGLSKTNVYSNSSSSNVNLGNESTFIYTEGSSKVTNNATITSGTNGKIIAIYGKDGADIVNNGIIDLSHGTGNQGILVTGASNAVNRGVIKIGKTDKSDPNNIIYGIGMAAVGGANISNERDIYVTENLGIGMYGDDRGTTLRNSGNIYLDSSNASASNKVQTMMGVFVNNGAKFVNTGNITTTGSYHGNDNVQGLVGVAVLN